MPKEPKSIAFNWKAEPGQHTELNRRAKACSFDSIGDLLRHVARRLESEPLEGLTYEFVNQTMAELRERNGQRKRKWEQQLAQMGKRER